LAESPTRVAAKAMLKEKEKSMGNSPTNQGGDQPADTPTTGDPEEPGTEAQPDPEGDPTPPATQPESQPSADPVVTTPENRATEGVLIDGKMVTDWKVINQHFAAMSAAQNEARETFRKNFVEGLAAANKIPAPQVDSLVALVNGDGDKVPPMSDEQFASFQASYESSAPSSLFDNHASQRDAGQPGQPGSPAQMSDEQKKDRIEVLQGTVAMHERTMSPEQVKNTKSYIELQQLLGNNES